MSGTRAPFNGGRKMSDDIMRMRDVPHIGRTPRHDPPNIAQRLPGHLRS
jgi:hypothetical protein